MPTSSRKWRWTESFGTSAQIQLLNCCVDVRRFRVQEFCHSYCIRGMLAPSSASTWRSCRGAGFLQAMLWTCTGIMPSVLMNCREPGFSARDIIVQEKICQVNCHCFCVVVSRGTICSKRGFNRSGPRNLFSEVQLILLNATSAGASKRGSGKLRRLASHQS